MDILNKLSRIFFPEVCPFCGEIIPLTQNECHCLSDAYFISDSFCEHCGCDRDKCSCSDTYTADIHKLCGVYIYSGKVKKALHRLKFGREKSIAAPLGDKMSLRVVQCFPEADLDLVCCVPMYKSDKRKRGYNQSELLAKRVAKRLFIPYKPCLVKRVKTPNQRSLSANMRSTNLIGTIALSDPETVKGKTVLLCDDIKTTGSTLYECQMALTDAGAKEVICLCCGVAYLDKPDFP